MSAACVGARSVAKWGEVGESFACAEQTLMKSPCARNAAETAAAWTGGAKVNIEGVLLEMMRKLTCCATRFPISLLAAR